MLLDALPLPELCSINLAVQISGRPKAVLYRWIRDGLLPVRVLGVKWQAVALTDLADAIGKPIDAAVYLDAVCKRELKATVAGTRQGTAAKQHTAPRRRAGQGHSPQSNNTARSRITVSSPPPKDASSGTPIE